VDALLAALEVQVAVGQRIEPAQLALASPCPGWSVHDVLGHTWDVAEATGQRVECPDDLWAAGLDAARLVIGPDRDQAHYAPQLPTPGDATPIVRFLAYLGRGPAEP
jgi:hypothetical protein